MSSPLLPASILLQPLHSPLTAWKFIFRPGEFYSSVRQRFGEIVLIRAPGVSLAMTLSPEGARQILTASPVDYEAFQKEAFTGLAGEGSLFVLEKEAHRDERRLLMPAFHPHHVRHYSSMVQGIVRNHTKNWRSGLKINGMDLGLDISRDVILSVVYGDDFERIKERGRAVVRRMLDATHPMLEYLHQTQAFWFPPWWRFVRARKDFDRFAAETIASRREFRSTENDVLGKLMREDNSLKQGKSDQEIIDELYTVLLPGHATTGVAISWVLYEILRHPEVMEQLRDELDTLGGNLDPDPMMKLPYLEAVCNESMRLHTIVTETSRLNLSDKEILGFQIPPGFGLGIGIQAIHHDPELYPEPDKFKPERFLERAFSPFEFLPFGGGHRRCLGAALSDFEVRLTIGNIVSRWDLESIGGKEIEFRHNLGMGPKHRVPLKVLGQRGG